VSKTSNFIFRGTLLRISHCKPSTQQASNKTVTKKLVDSTSGTVDWNITNIYYGTLITRAAMRNIYQEDNNVTHPNRFGVIAHSLIENGTNLSSRFVIDEKNKKFAIIISNSATYNNMIADGVSIDIQFEWNFRE